ncbi:DsbA family oxidoreductase [Lederbergia galactosidilytica]|uniref:DSBA oxidoreductase n=1 Tax=Lederbergia galactosidilytica TaxID=217031 RepID=A0A178A1X5_9BACI|nr:DsbA family oxidoreductase [Lederbergia galactosidilytica]KRG12341.1 DSBA oxidoreductase [Virgibacillus soli]MBP1913863.1 putative DsbA family dithiol-disulfide isomerase [Lederbergia galactosidilytica]OAK73913.1 DSBA oxidoreductase [Lederbergia galactosidilytica]
MKIEVWSDFVCPFCYIGKRRLEQALEKFPQKDEVEVEFRSYELDPTTAKNQDKTIHEALAMKYGMSVDEAKKMNEGVGEQAKGVGLNFQFDTMVPANTFDAHRLAHFAKTKAKDKEITERLLHAYFTEGKRLSDHDVLAELAVEVGLERNEVFEVLQDETAYADDVRYDENTAQQIGVRGVPFFVVNQKYAISGAQPMETFVGALEKVWQEEKAAPVLQDLSGDADDAACVDGNCVIPNDKE